MITCDSQEGPSRWSLLQGVLAFAGVVVIATVVLLVGTIAAAIGLGLGLVVMPWLMPLLGFVLRRLWKPSERSGARRSSASAVGHRGNASLTRTSRGPIPVH